MTAGYLASRKIKFDEYWNSFIMRHRIIMNDQKDRASPYVTAHVFDETEPVFFVNMSLIQDLLTTLQVKTVAATAQPNSQPDTLPPSSRSVLNSLNCLISMAICLICPPSRGFLNLWFIQTMISSNFSSYNTWNYIWAAKQPPWLKTHPCPRKVMTARGRISSKYMRTIICYSLNTWGVFYSVRQLASLLLASLSALRLLWIDQNARSPHSNVQLISGSDWFLFLTVKKLDPATKIYWQSSLDNSKEIPTFDSLLVFLDTRIKALTMTYADSTGQPRKPHPRQANQKARLKGQRHTLFRHQKISIRVRSAKRSTHEVIALNSKLFQLVNAWHRRRPSRPA